MSTTRLATLKGAVGTKGLERGTELLLKQKRARGIPDHAQMSQDPREVQFALQYLDAFGYLVHALADWDDIKLPDITRAVKQFQGVFGLARNGQLCSKTIRAMEAPRCGCPDVSRAHHLQYRAVQKWARAMLPAWKKRGLVYAIADYLPSLAQSDVDLVVASAFAAWTQLGNVDVAQTKDPTKSDIVISTGEGPRSNFDGPGGVLAWAYMPDGNDQQLTMKFDLSETWVLGPNDRGIILLNVATHEFGHLFGLDHSVVQSALMAPYYNAATATPQANDDIPRFQTRYGVRSGLPAPTPAPTPTPTPSPTPVPPPASSKVGIAISGDVNVWVNDKKVV